MKKLFVLLLCLVLVLGTATLAACNDEEEPSTPTAKVVHTVNTYHVGDELNLNAQVEINDNGAVTSVPLTADMVSGFSTEKIAGMAEATVTCNGITAPYYYFVSVPATAPQDTSKTKYSDLSYGTTESHVFDLYLPDTLANLTGDEPVFLYVHGGGWMIGDKSENASSMIPAFTEQGFVVLTMNYTLAGVNASVKDQYSEIGAMVAYMKDFLPAIGLSADKICIGGYSAGGHLSTWYAYASAGYSPLEIGFLVDVVGPVDVSDEGYRAAFEHLRTDGAGIIKAFTPTFCDIIGIPSEGVDLVNGDMAPVWEGISKLSGLPYVNADTCPTIMMYAEGDVAYDEDNTPNYGGIFVTQNDGLVPLTCYTNLKEKLDEAGVVNVSRVFEGETHMTLGTSETACAWVSQQAKAYADLYLTAN